MQRVVLFFVSILFLSTSLSAGELAEFGIRAGTNMTFPRGLPDGTTSTSFVGLNAGIYGQIGLGDLLAVGADLYYESRTIKLEQVIAGEVTRSDVYAGSLNLPVVARIGLPLKFMLDLGVMYSHMLDKSGATFPDGQGFVVAGLIWRPLKAFRIGARYLPSFSSISNETYTDIGVNLTEIYVGFVLF